METPHPAPPTGSGYALIEQLGIALPAAPMVLTDDLIERLAAYAAAAAPNSLRALRCDFALIAASQAARGKPPLPLSPGDLYWLIDERAAAGRAKSSIDRLVASAVRLHRLFDLPDPINDTVRWALKAMRKADRREPRQALGLRLKGDVVDWRHDATAPVSLLALLRSIPDDLAGLRDRALLSCGYDAGLRRSELVAARLGDLTRLASGEGSLLLPRSKTDQEGDGAGVWLSLRSMDALRRWCDAAAINDGYLFRSLSRRVSAAGHLSPGAVAKVLKRRLAALLGEHIAQRVIEPGEAAALVAAVSGHSLRVGCDQDLIAAGVDIGAIMHGLRWKSPKQPLAYARHLAPATSQLAAALRAIG
jgi:integrase